MSQRSPSTANATLRDGVPVGRRKLPTIRSSPPQRPLQQPEYERMPICREQIGLLASEARKRGDRFFAGVCERALRGEPDAVNACKAALYGLG